ncbi:unnamed protein product [Calypogeia fissa]
MHSFLAKFFPSVLAKQGTGNNYCKYNNHELQLFTSSLYIAGLIATFAAGYTSRRFGRLLTMRVAASCFVIGTVLCASAPVLYVVIIGRVILGIGVGLANQWERLLSSFLVEAEGRAQKKVGVTDEDLKMASTTSGLVAIVFSSVLMSGVVENPYFVTWMEKDSTLLRTASEAVGLAPSIIFQNGANTMQRDKSQLNVRKQQMTKELNWQQGQASTVPSIVKRVLVSFTKVANVYYDSHYEQHSLAELQRLWVSHVE